MLIKNASVRLDFLCQCIKSGQVSAEQITEYFKNEAVKQYYLENNSTEEVYH